MTATHSSISNGFISGTALSTTAPTGEAIDVVSTQAQSVAVVIGAAQATASEGTVGAIAQGSATAIGTDTLAAGALVATAEIGGAYDSAHAAASFVAAGVDGSGGPAFATAEAFARVTGTFDIVISTHDAASTIATVGEASLWYEAQSVSVTGIDVGGSATVAVASVSGDATDAGSMGLAIAPDMDVAGDGDGGCPSQPPEVDLDFELAGNLAFVDVDVTALGPNTFADAVVLAVAIEDQLSTVDGLVIAHVSI